MQFNYASAEDAMSHLFDPAAPLAFSESGPIVRWGCEHGRYWFQDPRVDISNCGVARGRRFVGTAYTTSREQAECLIRAEGYTPGRYDA